MKPFDVLLAELAHDAVQTDAPGSLSLYRIPDSEPVIWDGEQTTFGQLSGNERMSCERNIDGVLEGGYPI